MRIFSIAAVSATNLFIGFHYIWAIRRGRISPALAMWIFFTIAVIGSLLTYLAEGDFGLLDNILNTADLALVSSVAVAIALWGDRSTRFNRFDLVCLAAVAVILVVWAFTRQHAATHSAIQLILVIAYFPVVKRLWRSDRNTESFVMWIGLMLAPIFSLLSSKGPLATVYAVRAIVCAGALMLLMLRAKRRGRRSRPELQESADSNSNCGQGRIRTDCWDPLQDPSESKDRHAQGLGSWTDSYGLATGHKRYERSSA